MSNKKNWKNTEKRLDSVTYGPIRKLFYHEYPFKLVLRGNFPEPILKMFSTATRFMREFNYESSRKSRYSYYDYRRRTMFNSVNIKKPEDASKIFFRSAFFENEDSNYAKTVHIQNKGYKDIIRYPPAILKEENENVENIFSSDTVNEFNTIYSYLFSIFQIYTDELEITSETICYPAIHNQILLEEKETYSLYFYDYIYEMTATFLALIKFCVEKNDDLLNNKVRYQFRKSPHDNLVLRKKSGEDEKLCEAMLFAASNTDLSSITIYSKNLEDLHELIEQNPSLLYFVESINAPSLEALNKLKMSDNLLICPNGIPNPDFTKRIILKNVDVPKEESLALAELLLDYHDQDVIICTSYAKSVLKNALLGYGLDHWLYSSFSFDVEEEYLDIVLSTIYVVCGDRATYNINTLIDP